MKSIIISLSKSVFFIFFMTAAGYGLIPEVGDRHGAFSFLCLSLAALIAWSEIKSFVREVKK